MPVANSLSPQEARVIEIWRGNGRRESTIAVYLRWVREYEKLLASCDAPDLQLTRQGVATFARAYSEARGIDKINAERCARFALKAWSFGLRMAGYSVPEWETKPQRARLPLVLAEYKDFRWRHAGVAQSTIRRDLALLPAFLRHVRYPTRSLEDLLLKDIDDFVTEAGIRWSRKTVARLCTTLRTFLRFLHHRGYLSHDLASSVTAPVVRAAERPPRALPWNEVQRLLGSIDTGLRTGLRDYALLLMMATYGMGSAEVIHLQLDDIGWSRGSIRAVRPKTGCGYSLPLLPPIAHALTTYLREGRPSYSTTRAVFVRAVVPHGPMTSSAIRHLIRTHGRNAGIAANRLGGHILRHSHACRQIELGAPTKVVSDILGHRDPSSTSAYIRIATTRLRALALPVPV